MHKLKRFARGATRLGFVDVLTVVVLLGIHSIVYTYFMATGKWAKEVVRVYELGEHDGLPYYSMELMEGGTLKARLARGPMEPREAAGVVRVLGRHQHRAADAIASYS